MTPSETGQGWQRGACLVNQLQIHFWRSGGTNPPLVALHGLMGSGGCLLPMARMLDGYDVILPDARGHGESSAPAYGYAYDDLAGDVVGLLGALALEAPVLVGHSMGGLTAAAAARALGSNLAALVLIDPTFISPARQREAFDSDVAAEHRKSLDSSRESLLAAARKKHPARSAELIEYLVDARLSTSPNAFEVLTPPNPDWRELVRELCVPTLLLIGERGVVSPESGAELQATNSLLSIEHLSGAGHGMPYDAPERVASAVSAFLASLRASYPVLTWTAGRSFPRVPRVSVDRP